MPGTAVLLNMQELALAIGTSRQSLSLWVKKYADFPMVQRGTNGLPFRFDLKAVVTFLRERQEQEAERLEERDAALAQLVLPLQLETTPTDPTLSLKDQISAVTLSRMKREEAERLGRLVAASGVTVALTAAFAAWNRTLRAAIRQAGIDLNLPEAVTMDLDRRLADAQRGFVREAAAYLTPSDAPLDTTGHARATG